MWSLIWLLRPFIVSYNCVGVMDYESSSHDSTCIWCWVTLVVDEKSSKLSFLQFCCPAVLWIFCSTGKLRIYFVCYLLDVFPNEVSCEIFEKDVSKCCYWNMLIDFIVVLIFCYRHFWVHCQRSWKDLGCTT